MQRTLCWERRLFFFFFPRVHPITAGVDYNGFLEEIAAAPTGVRQTWVRRGTRIGNFQAAQRRVVDFRAHCRHRENRQYIKKKERNAQLLHSAEDYSKQPINECAYTGSLQLKLVDINSDRVGNVCSSVARKWLSGNARIHAQERHPRGALKKSVFRKYFLYLKLGLMLRVVCICAYCFFFAHWRHSETGKANMILIEIVCELFYNCFGYLAMALCGFDVKSHISAAAYLEMRQLITQFVMNWLNEKLFISCVSVRTLNFFPPPRFSLHFPVSRVQAWERGKNLTGLSLVCLLAFPLSVLSLFLALCAT